MEQLVIVGTSTNARHLYRFVTDYNLYEIIGFAVDAEYRTIDTLYGKPVFALGNLENEIDKSKVRLFIALLWNRLNADRRSLYMRLKKQGYRFANIISPRAAIRGDMRGDNCWIHDFVIIQNDTVVGDDVAIMAFSLIGADSVIGDHCFLGAKSTIGGGSCIGDQSFVGMNCTVFDDTKIGKKCILGACTAVKRNMPDYALIKTSSNLEIRQYDEASIEDKLRFSKNVR